MGCKFALKYARFSMRTFNNFIAIPKWLAGVGFGKNSLSFSSVRNRICVLMDRSSNTCLISFLHENLIKHFTWLARLFMIQCAVLRVTPAHTSFVVLISDKCKYSKSSACVTAWTCRQKCSQWRPRLIKKKCVLMWVLYVYASSIQNPVSCSRKCPSDLSVYWISPHISPTWCSK